MRLIDGDKFLEYLIFSKHIDGLTCKEVKEAVEMCKVDVLEQIVDEIEQYNQKPSHYPVNTISIKTVLQIIDKYRGGKNETDN